MSKFLHVTLTDGKTMVLNPKYIIRAYSYNCRTHLVLAEVDAAIGENAHRELVVRETLTQLFPPF